MGSVLSLPRRRLRLRVVPLLVLAAVGWIAYDNGSYGVERQNAVAIVVWWLVLVAVVFGLGIAAWPLEARAAVGLAAALSLWTLLSVVWAANAEDAFAEFDHTALYTGVIVLGIFAVRLGRARCIDGIAAAIAVTAALALASRYFPSLFPTRGLPAFLPSSESRLSFPLGYWNGLAIFSGMGVPLLVGRAAARAPAAGRALALAAVPALVAAIYLASSRGGVLAAGVGLLVLLALAADRWGVLAAAVVGGLGSGVVLAFLASHKVVVDGPFGTAAASSQAHEAALVTLAACTVTGLAWAAVVRFAPERRPSRLVGRVAIAAVVVLVVAGAALSHPRARFESFKQPPGAVSFSDRNFVSAHLLSGAGSGRWQFWGSAVDEWRSAPLLGRGAGSFASWWAQHGPISYYILDAHSLYLQTLGELGIVGGLLVVALVVVGLVGGARRALLAVRGRALAAAGTATFAAWAVGAGIDWMWQLPAVTATAMLLLGLLVAPDADAAAAAAAAGLEKRSRLGVVAVVAIAAWLVVCAEAIPFAAQLKIGDSQAAVRRGDLTTALADARTARNVQPWAASPYLQLALVAEQRGELARARGWIGDATRRSRDDWRLWLVTARIETESGRVAAARAALHRAERLNPRSPLFAHLAG